MCALRFEGVGITLEGYRRSSSYLGFCSLCLVDEGRLADPEPEGTARVEAAWASHGPNSGLRAEAESALT